MKVINIIGIVVGVVLFLIAMNSFTTVPAGHTKVSDYFGAVNDTELTEGFHVVNPILDFTKYDTRDQTYTWKEIKVPSQDKLKSTMDVSVTFNLVKSMTSNMKKTVGDGDAVVSTYITPKVRSLMREVGKTVLRSQDFFLDTTQLEMQAYMEEGLNSYLEPKGVNVTAVLFKDISLPEVVTNAIIKTKESEELLEREKAQLDIAEQKAQQLVKQAEAREDASVADAQVIENLATAQAIANTKLAKSLTNQLIEYKRLEEWNGVYPTTMLGADTGVLLGLNK